MKRNQWIKPFLFALLVLVVPIAGYYVYFVESREAFLLERFHAHLANTAARAEEKFKSALDIIRYNPDKRNELGVKECGSARALDTTGPDRFVSRSASGEITLHDGKSLREGKLCDAAVDIDALVGSVDPDRQFYDVVIVDETGRVVYQRDRVNGRIADGQLVPVVADSKPADGKPAEARSADAKSGDAKSAVKDPLFEMRKNYQGRPFLLFTQPMAVPVKNERIGSWQMVGLLGQSEFASLKYRASPGGLALVVLGFLAVLLAGPFLKLQYLGRFEHVSRFDIVIQLGTGLSLIAMCTVAWLAWNTHARLETYFDKQLATAATNLSGAVDNEFRAAVKTLQNLEPDMVDAYTARLKRQTPQWNSGDCPLLADGKNDSPASSTVLPTAAGDILQQQPKQLDTAGYRQMIMVYLMDQKGCQLVKWASDPIPPKPGPFADRAYFKRALPDERNDLRLEKSVDNIPYFEDVIVSRTTGDRQIAFSKPVNNATDCTSALRKKDDDKQPRVPCVSVINGTVRALDAVLPHGFGAMLIDANADIKWRSDGDTSTELNLAKEIDEPVRLSTIARLAGEAGSYAGEQFDAEYHRVPHRFKVVPLGMGHLALVTFYNRNLVTATVLESVGAGSTAWIIWASLLTTLFLALWIIDDMTERSLRRWPLCLALVLPAALGATWFALAVSPPLLFAAAGIVVCLLPLVLLARQSSAHINAQMRRLIVVFPTWLAVMLAAAVPMSVLYGQAEQATLSALTRFEQHEFDHDVLDQRKSFDQWKHRVGLADESGWTGFAWQNQQFVVSKKEAVSEANKDASECRLFDIVCHILTGLPDYGDAMSGIHAMHRSSDRPIERIRSTLLAGEPATYPFHIALGILALLLSIVAVWYLLVRTFGLRAENVVEVSFSNKPDGSGEAHHLVYGVPASRKQEYRDALQSVEKFWLDLRDTSPESRIEVPSTAEAVLLDEFDSNLNDIAVVRQRLELLERLLREQRRVILLFVGTDPLNFVMGHYDVEKDAVLLSRFATALSRFKLTYYAHSLPSSETTGVHVVSRLRAAFQHSLANYERSQWRKQLVESECAHPDLWEIRDDLLNEADVHHWSKGQIIQQVQSRANAIYQQMWSRLTRVEKFTLIELALGHSVNPNNWEAARRLRVRGFVEPAPFYRIASESLRQFAAQMGQIEDVQRWRAENPGVWDQIKVPLIVVLIGVVAFVALTQPALFNSLFAFLAAGAASFPFIVSALSARLQRSASGGK